MLFLFLLVSQTTAQSYCTCGPSTQTDANLGTVQLAGDTKTIYDDSNCPGTVGIRDLTALVADLSANRSYSLVYTVTTCGNSFPTVAGAWIDYNRNSQFDTNELLAPFSTAKNAVEIKFTTPPTGVNFVAGTTRMRVQVQETQALTINPCGSFPYGATKDFSIALNGGPPPPPPPPVDPMCQSGPLASDDSNLGSVTLIGESRNIREKTDCPGQPGAQNFLNLVADVVRGEKYTLTFNVTTCGKRYATLSAAWIDYDHDLIFSTSDVINDYTRAQGVVNLDFLVPLGDYVGDTVMRVQVQETLSTKIDPCQTFSFGGTKDFTITLLPAGSPKRSSNISILL